MGLLRLSRRAPREEPPPPERPEVSDYRDFLLTAPRDELVAVHRQVLPGLDLFVRAVILNTARGLTGEGAGVAPEDTFGLTELLLAGDGAERVAVLEAYDDAVRHRLAHAVAVALRPPVEEPVEEASGEAAPAHGADERSTLSQVDEFSKAATLLP
jgi:hypothetical protein